MQPVCNFYNKNSLWLSLVFGVLPSCGNALGGKIHFFIVNLYKNKNMINSDIEKLLSDKGVKPTANRVLVMKELMHATHPVNLADLEALLGFTMDKASIFRVLELFSEKDVVHVIEDGSRSLKYELCHSGADHSIADQHAHFYCERCKETYCMEAAMVPMIDIPDGFTPHSINYVIKGTCPKCSR